MKYFKNIFFISFVVVILSGCSQIPFLQPKQAAVQINSSPTATIFLNETHIGQTPFFDENLKPGEYVLKLQVDNDPSKVWQTKITLSSKIVTVVSRDFGDTENQSSNYILQLEPLTSSEATELSIITNPDQAVVKIDGQPEGFSPMVLRDNIQPGDHTISIIKPGFQEQVIAAQIQVGYKLLVSSQLAQALALNISPESSDSANIPTEDATPSSQVDDEDAEEPGTEADKADESPTPKPTKKASTTTSSTGETVKIIETGTGWLRVRSEPTASQDNEVAKVDVGESYPFIEENETGWYKIEYETGEEGWISGKYAEKQTQ